MGVLDTARSKGIHRPHLRDNQKINKAAGVVGHSKQKGWSSEHAEQHRSAPLSTLKDPDAFGPPPKHRAAAALTPASSSEVAPPALPSASKPTSTPPAQPAQPAKPSYASRGLGAPLPQQAVHTYRREQGLEPPEETKPAPPPVPYRFDTTGLNTSNFAKPPVRRADPNDNGPTAPSPSRAVPPPKPAARPTPQPPPRLPQRQNSHPGEHDPPPPPPYAEPAQTDQSATQHQQPAAPTSMDQLSELQTRFARLPGRVSSPPAEPSATSTQPAQPSGQGSTWAQKQAALRTATQAQRDPSSVSAADAYSAAKTAQDFHQRHGEQISSGVDKARGLDSKYDIRGRVGALAQSQPQSQETQQAATAAHKKPPPPPPPASRKPELHTESNNNPAPPPIPMSSKPT